MLDHAINIWIYQSQSPVILPVPVLNRCNMLCHGYDGSWLQKFLFWASDRKLIELPYGIMIVRKEWTLVKNWGNGFTTKSIRRDPFQRQLSNVPTRSKVIVMEHLGTKFYHSCIQKTKLGCASIRIWVSISQGALLLESALLLGWIRYAQFPVSQHFQHLFTPKN